MTIHPAYTSRKFVQTIVADGMLLMIAIFWLLRAEMASVAHWTAWFTALLAINGIYTAGNVAQKRVEHTNNNRPPVPVPEPPKDSGR